MKHEYCAGAILFTVINEEIKYILVEESDGHIGFPKGHLEPGETDEICALREIWEETGICATLLNEFRELVEYPKAKDVMKHVTFFVGTYTDQTPKHKEDEVNGLHILPYKEAFDCLTYQNSKEWLRKANQYIAAIVSEKK